MAPPRTLSLLEKIDIPIGFAQAICATIFTAIAAPFRGSNAPKTLSRHLLLAVTRKVLVRLSPVQLQSIAGSTESNYLAWTKAKNITPRSIDIPGFDTKAFWLGSPNADNVVIYYHGGGFAMPGGDGHFVFVSSLVSNATAAGKSVAVLFLQYELAPGGQYPRQHVQAVELLRYATTELKKSPSQIMLMGDSAGANMILGVLSHLLHPHPAIKPLRLSSPLAGALICSPVTVLNTNNERFRTQEVQDPAAAETIRTWLSNLLGSSKPDAWNQPLDNEPTWWNGLGNAAKEVLITVASVEMMADDTRALAAKMKTVHPQLTLFASEVDFHAEPTIGPSLGMPEGDVAKYMISWAIERSL